MLRTQTIGLFGSKTQQTNPDTYHLTALGKMRRLWQIARIATRVDVVRGLTPVTMRLMLEALGPTFVKVGQILSMRSEILPDAFCKELSKLRANADPMPYQTVVNTLAQEYGRPVEEVFSRIDPTPLGSASLAQVHRAKLVSGEDVAIKVQRPGVREIMAQDIDIMRSFAKVSTRFARSAQILDLKGVVEELWETFQT
ncbi:MAG: AarF/UbiB family protein, partial [Bifidobacterium crudilactis]|nr:AarF/UbiB family protein [Bifidobacterium crudilactis]